MVEVTPSCNLSCRFCCNPWHISSAPPRPRPGLASELVASLGRLSPSGITLSGGEPLLRDDLAGIVRTAHDAASRVILATNGTLLTRDLAVQLADAGLGGFQITIPTCDGLLFGRLCGAGDPVPVRSAIASAASTGLPVSAGFPVTSANWREAAAVLRTSVAFGAGSFMLLRLASGGRASKPGFDLFPTPDQLGAAAMDACEAGAALGITVYAGITMEQCSFDLPPGMADEGCTGAVVKWAVDPWGRLRPCEQSPVILGDLLEEGFETLSVCAGAESFRLWRRGGGCGSCMSAEACRGGCRYVPQG